MADTARDPLEDRIRERHLRDYARGETVYSGGGGGQVYLVASGDVEIVRHDASGPRRVDRFATGGLFGDIGAMAANPADTAIAREATRLLQVDLATFEQMCVDRPEVGLRIIRVLSEQLGQAQQWRARDADSLGPLVAVLAELAVPDPAGVRMQTNLRDLADRAGLSMSDAHRGLQILFERKLLRLVGDELVALSVESLRTGLQPTS